MATIDGSVKAKGRKKFALSVIFSLLFSLLFLVIVAYIRRFDVEAMGFERGGARLLLYHFSRLGLGLYVTAFCYLAGYHTFKLFGISPESLFKATRKIFILCFFFGASLYGIVFTVLGLAGSINLATSFALTIPVLFLSYWPIKALLPNQFWTRVFQQTTDTHASRAFVWIVILAVIGTAILFLLTRVIFIPNIDGNIWEHYLHYYRAVLISGSTQPNEVWHHFYNSKAGGVTFLAGALSDVFAVQIVSACFVSVAGLIVFDLLVKFCRSITWALFGVMLYLVFFYGAVHDGALFRVHGVILGYASFILWGGIWLQQVGLRQVKALMIALVIALAYLGFYQPVATALFVPIFLLIAITKLKCGDKQLFFNFLMLACILTVGTGLDLVVNWIFTGLAEVTPIKYFWAIANHEKVEKVFGIGGIQFFLAVNNDLWSYASWIETVRSLSYNALATLRRPLLNELMILTLFGFLILLDRMIARRQEGRGLTKTDLFLLQLVVFVMPLIAFSVLIPSPSVYRLGVYSIVPVTLVVVVIWKNLVDRFVGGKHRQAISAAIMLCGMSTAIAQATSQSRSQLPTIVKYAIGMRSLKDTFQAMESVLGRASGTGIASMSEFRQMVGPNGRVLSLVADAGYSYFLPKSGILSEPTYSILKSPQKVFTEDPDRIKDTLHERGIEYFSLNLQRRLFSTIAFSSLFDPREMRKYLRIAYESADFFVLTWRENEKSAPLPDHLLILMDLKRTGVLHIPFTQKFSSSLLVQGEETLVGNMDEFESIKNAFRRDINNLFLTEMLPLVSLDTSKASLRHIFKVGGDAIYEVEPNKILNVRRSATGQIRVVEKISENELRLRLYMFFLGEIEKEYALEFGQEVATLSKNCDERFPFAMEYSVDDRCK